MKGSPQAQAAPDDDLYDAEHGRYVLWMSPGVGSMKMLEFSQVIDFAMCWRLLVVAVVVAVDVTLLTVPWSLFCGAVAVDGCDTWANASLTTLEPIQGDVAAFQMLLLLLQLLDVAVDLIWSGLVGVVAPLFFFSVDVLIPHKFYMDCCTFVLCLLYLCFVSTVPFCVCCTFVLCLLYLFCAYCCTFA